jgi:chromosome segregation ATPase
MGLPEFQFRRRLEETENKDRQQDTDLQNIDNRVTRLENSDGDQNTKLGNLEGRVGNAENEAGQARADASQAARDAAAARGDATAAGQAAAAAQGTASDARTRADGITDKVNNQIEPALAGKVPFADFQDHEGEFGTFRTSTGQRLDNVDGEITGLKTGVQEAKDKAQEAKGDALTARGEAALNSNLIQDNKTAIGDLQNRQNAQSGQIERLTGELDRVGGVTAGLGNDVGEIRRGLDSFKFGMGESAEAGRSDLEDALNDMSNAAGHLRDADTKWNQAATAGITSINDARAGIIDMFNAAVNLSWSQLKDGIDKLRRAFVNFVTFPVRVGEAAGDTILGAQDILRAVSKVRGAGADLRKSLEKATSALPDFRE